MRVLSCGNISKNLIILILVPFISGINSFAGEWLAFDDIDLNSHPFFIQIFTCFCEIVVGGVLELILRKRNKRQERKTLSRNTFIENSDMYFELVREKTKKKTFLLIVLVLVNMVIDCSAMTLMYLKLNSNESDIELRTNFLIIQIIFNGLVSILILKYPIYKHHYFSIALLFIGFLLVSFQYFTSLSEDLTSLYIVICYMLWAIQETNAKWIMKELYISPYFLLFLYGLVGLVVQLLLAVPLSFIPCELDFCSIEGVVESYFSTLAAVFSHSMICLSLWLYSISVAVYMLFLIIVNNAFNPTHSCTAESFENVVWWIYSLIENGVDIYFIPSVLGYAVIVFAGLVYNEIFIFSLFGLEENTKQVIQSRSEKEKDSLNISLKEINVKDVVA